MALELHVWLTKTEEDDFEQLTELGKLLSSRGFIDYEIVEVN